MSPLQPWSMALTAMLAWTCSALADPTLASVRIKSHGGSGTIIATMEGRSWILSCAHLFTDQQGRPSEAERAKPLRIDGPLQPFAIKKRAEARLLACDYELDLSLIEIENGPFFQVPVARRGHVPSKNLVSLGYDNMAWPITRQGVTLLGSRGITTFTVEKPWHGRSGGGLIDLDNHCLIGVVQGFEINHAERGLYVSHAALLRFLETNWNKAPRPPPVPEPQRRQQYSRPPIVVPNCSQ